MQSDTVGTDVGARVIVGDSDGEYVGVVVGDNVGDVDSACDCADGSIIVVIVSTITPAGPSRSGVIFARGRKFSSMPFLQLESAAEVTSACILGRTSTHWNRFTVLLSIFTCRFGADASSR